MNNNYYAILMAGGVGSRFWPVSTPDFPKQFHDMLGTGETLIQKTFSRLSQIIPKENILILTNEKYSKLVLEQLPKIKESQIISEPVMRNTAPCILYASLKIKKENPKALVLVAPSDHWIENEKQFADDIIQSFTFCEKQDALMTLGIIPTFPNTGYGYIEFDKNEVDHIKKVKQFREKPDYETAKKFIQDKNFLWNAGIFIWSAKSILSSFENYQPQMFELFMQGFDFYNSNEEKTFIDSNYSLSENISIDYAILEKAANVYLLCANFDWNDLGTWGSLYDKLPKNESLNAVVNADIYTENASHNIIRTDGKKLVVIDGLNDYIIVDKENILLIYPKSKEQDIKEIVKRIK